VPRPAAREDDETLGGLRAVFFRTGHFDLII
jgi:hypothetical protein